MNTPIYDFVCRYRDLRPARFHMPGHKGRGPLGCEDLDLTEIPGADSLYEAAGIIAESEANAARLFGCPTFYSTEGSSHCIRAMLLLAARHAAGQGREPKILAARNAHSTFLSAVALLRLKVCWLRDGAPTYLSARLTPEGVEKAILAERPTALYLTAPDYLGDLPDLGPIAAVCRRCGVLLLVDNAHGAYLRFLPSSRHPMDLGADLCCDSAHKTCPVLTGGAWLHVSDRLGLPAPDVREALAIFGSTSPSYLILQSLDLCNLWLEALPGRMPEFLEKVERLKADLRACGWTLYGDEPWKLTLRPRLRGLSGIELADALAERGILCEFFDPDYAVLMLTPNNPDGDLERLRAALAAVEPRPAQPEIAARPGCPETVCPPAEAMLLPCERIPAAQSLGRVLARPGVSCPPAVPILMPGERIDEAACAAFAAYGVETCTVLRETTNDSERRNDS